MMSQTSSGTSDLPRDEGTIEFSEDETHGGKQSTQGPLFEFRGITFSVKAKGGEKVILNDVSHSVAPGTMFAVMGPSGSGKTTLMNILSLQSKRGRLSGEILFKGAPFTGKNFREFCFYLPQYDTNWHYLTCRQVMSFAAKLYGNTEPELIESVVTATLESMGLLDAIDTSCSGLSGGQQRRLSLGVALLKNPKILFLDEVTSGLDSAAAERVVHVLSNIVKERNLVVICNIHQPSTSVLEKFHELLLLSKGSVAYAGSLAGAEEHFAGLGYPLPEHTNPSEHYLKLINTDFSGMAEAREVCIEAWRDKCSVLESGVKKTFESTARTLGSSLPRGLDSIEKSLGMSSSYGQDECLTSKKNGGWSWLEFKTMLHRHFLITIRDPILYLGRCVSFLVTNSIFAFVYWNAREGTQDQIVNQVWLPMWYMTVPAMMGVVAVYFLFEEFKLIRGEIKNGMNGCISYILAKFVLTFPIITVVFSLSALAIPMFVIQSFDVSHFLPFFGQWALIMYLFESFAECLAVWSPNAIVGMLAYLTYWITAFLFGGVFLPPDDIYWPLKAFYYGMPFNYYTRSFVHLLFSNEQYEPCDPVSNVSSQVCVESGDGEDVVKALEFLFPVTANPNTVRDTFCLFAMILLFKSLYIAGVFTFTEVRK